jgi:hypothetical protein
MPVARKRERSNRALLALRPQPSNLSSKILGSLYPQSRLVIGEAGWASVASEFGKRASEENQKRYVNELTAWATRNHVTAFIFEAFDEDWKGDPSDALGAEKHWDLFTVDRKAKLAMHELYPDLVAAKGKE